MEINIIEYRKTRDFGKKLNATIEFLKQNFKPLFKCLLYIAGPPVILGSLLISKAMTFFMTMSFTAELGNTPDEFEIISMSVYIFVAVIFLTIGGTAIVATTYDYMVIYEEKKTTDISVNEVWQKVKKSFWSVLGTMVLITLFLVLIYLIIIIPLFIFFTSAPALVILGFIVVLVAITYLSVVLSMVFIIRQYEGIGFGGAVSRAFGLIRSNWWLTFFLIFIVGLIRGMISSLFMIPWYINFIIFAVHSTQTGSFDDPSLTYQIINYVFLLLYLVSSYLLYCLPLIAIAFQYFHLVELKEAKGLMDKIDSFGNTETQEDEDEHY